jgi:hypothetical protein
MTPKLNQADWLEEAKITIRTSMNRAKDRYGFVSYWKNREAIQGALVVLNQIESATKHDDYEKVLELSLLVISAMTLLRRHNDDSDGDTGSLIFSANDYLRKITPMMSDDENTIFVHRIFKEALMKKYDEGYDVRCDLFNIAAEAVRCEADAKPLLKHLPELMKKDPKSEYNSDYIYATLAYIKTLHALSRNDEFNLLLKKSLNHDVIREYAIELSLEKENFEEALRLAQEGEKSARGFSVEQWQKPQLVALKALGRYDDYKQLCMKMAANGNAEAYHRLEDASSLSDWLTIYPKILDALETKRLAESPYQELLVEEKEWARLIKSIEKELVTIKVYYPMILAVDPLMANALYERFITEAAERANARPAYKGIAGLIRKYAKLTNKTNGEKMVLTLIHLYPKRSALIDELESIRFT